MNIKFKATIAKNAIDVEFKKNDNTISDSGFVSKGKNKEAWSTVKEVLVPFDQSQMPVTSGHSTGTVLTSGGVYESYDYVMYSTNKYATKDKFRWHGAVFEIIAINDYTGYSDVYIYFLKGMSNQYD